MDEAMETHGVMGMSTLIICDGEIGERIAVNSELRERLAR